MDRTQKQKAWSEIISAQESSGMYQKSWCEANGVNIHNFRYWKRRLKDNVCSPDIAEPVWVALTQATRNVENDGSLSIKIGNACIEINASSCMLTLEKVLQLLMKHA